MKTSTSLVLAAATFGVGLLAGRLLSDGEEVCKVDTPAAPAVHAELTRIAAPEPPPELERPDSRLVIGPDAPPETESAVPDHVRMAQDTALASSSQDPERTAQLKQIAEKMQKFIDAQEARRASAGAR